MQFSNYQDETFDFEEYVVEEYGDEDDDDDNFSDDDCIFEKRMKCWKDTKRICKIMTPPPKSVKVIYSNTVFTKKYNKSNIKFFNMDAIDCAIECKMENPLVLNLSDNCFAGGCVSSGSGAQEESLFRRTNYFLSLLQTFYPILPNEAVYSPQISVIKTSEKTDWKIIDKDKDCLMPPKTQKKQMFLN